MFASMFKTVLNKFGKKKLKSMDSDPEKVDIARRNVDRLLTEMNEMEEDSSSNLAMPDDNVADTIELLSVVDVPEGYLNDSDSVSNFDDDKSEVSSVGENRQDQVTAEVKDPNMVRLINQINSLQCLFTWKLKSKHRKNVVLSIQNNYGEYNLDITKAKFTFERYIGNLVISYEIFHRGKIELAQIKILEIGKWLEELDSCNDAFYSSIKIGLKHVMTATFIHMLFATNLSEECKWLLDDISSFANMDSKSRATVHAIRAAVLTEYGEDINYLKKACEFGKKACELDPNNPHWFYIHSLALMAERRFLCTYKSCPSKFEISAIQQAILLSDGKNVYYNYQRMTLDKDTIVDKFHRNENKHNKSVIDKNYQENRKIVQMIKTIMSMDPKDPHMVVKCAKIIMTLPRMVRDFKLGKQYLQSAVDMAPNDSTVLSAVAKAIDVYNKILNRNEQNAKTVHNKLPFKNKPLTFRDEMRFAVNKHKNGEDPIPYLVDLVAKYNGSNNNLKCKIVVQICSYKILFANDLKSGIEQFITLIEQHPEIINNSLITNHYSSFGSKKFNLAEFLCNEIRLATNSNKTPSDDMLFYYKMLTKIIETFSLNVKDVDSSMRVKLINHKSTDSCAGFTYSNTSITDESTVSDDESINSEVKQTNRRKNCKHLQNARPKTYVKNTAFEKSENVNNSKNTASNNSNKSKNAQNKSQYTRTYVKNPKLKKSEGKKNPNPKNTASKDSNAEKNTQNETYQATALSDTDQLKFKMSKFLNSTNKPPIFSNDVNHSFIESLRVLNLKTQAEIDANKLYQNILTNTRQLLNSQCDTSQDRFMLFNQNHANFNSPFQQVPTLQNQQPPPLLSLSPQINQHNPRPAVNHSSKKPSKKK